MNVFANFVRQIIEDEHYSIDALAAATGLPLPVLSGFVTGETWMNNDRVDKLARHLKVELKQVIYWDEYVAELRKNGRTEKAWQEYKNCAWEAYASAAWEEYERDAWHEYTEAAWDYVESDVWTAYEKTAWPEALASGDWTEGDHWKWYDMEYGCWVSGAFEEWSYKAYDAWRESEYPVWQRVAYAQWYDEEYPERERLLLAKIREELASRKYVVVLETRV